MHGYDSFKDSGNQVPTSYPHHGIPAGPHPLGINTGYAFPTDQMSAAAQHWGMVMNSHPGMQGSHALGPPPCYASPPMISPMNSIGNNLVLFPPPKPDAISTSPSDNRTGRGTKRSYNEHPNPVSPPPSRERFSFTRYQLELLNGIYTKIRYPNSMQKQLISKRVGITRDQVKVWFQNRRRKDIIGKKQTNIEVNATAPKMVPVSVMSGILNELLSFENNPKGKKTMTAQNSFDKKVAVRRSRENSESSVDDIPQPKSKRFRHTTEADEQLLAASNHSQNLLSNAFMQAQSFPIVQYARQSSPNNSLVIDTLNRRSISPYSNTSYHESDIMSTASGNSSAALETSNSSQATVANDTIEIQLQPNFTTISGEALDLPAPPNVVVPGVSAEILQRPRSLESPASDVYIPGGTTDDGLLISRNEVCIPQSNYIEVTTADISQIHTVTSPEKHKGSLNNTNHIGNAKQVVPNKVAPPSKPIHFNSSNIESHAMLISMPESVVTAEANAKEITRLKNSNNNNTLASISSSSSITSMPTSSAVTELISMTPHYAVTRETPAMSQYLAPLHSSVDPSMFYPNSYPSYAGHPYMYPEAPTGMPPVSVAGFDKALPYMFGCMPPGISFPAPSDPAFATGKLHENNNIGIFKDVYPPAFFAMQPYGSSSMHYTGASSIETATDLSGRKASTDI